MGHPSTYIRLADAGDIPTLVTFNQAMAKETEDKVLAQSTLEEGVSAVFSNKELGFYVVAERDALVVGSLLITKEWSDWRASHFWWIQSVFVDKPFRRQGIFRALFKEIESMAKKEKNVCGIRLYAEKENKGAQSTYLSIGMNESHYRLFEMDIT